MNLDEAEIKRLSGYERRADLRKWVRKNPMYHLNPPGRAGTVSATYVGPQKKKTVWEPNFERVTAKRRAAQG